MIKSSNQRVSSFTYTPPVSTKPGQQLTSSKSKLISFRVPPLDKTQLISVPEATGVADIVTLEVDPVNLALCGTTQKKYAPSSFDFRQEFADYISPIINQGTCGSCWAIASTQALSSRFALVRNQQALPLSAAYMLYCTRDTFSAKDDLSYGCTGGSLVDAYWFFNLNGTVSANCLKYDSLGAWDPTNSTNTDLRNREIAVGSDSSTTTKTAVMCPLTSCPRPPPLVFDNASYQADAPSIGSKQPKREQPWVFKTAISYIVPGTARQHGASEANIREEIWSNGPVSSGFQVTEDFIVYWKGLLENSLKGAARIYTPGAPDDTTNAVQGNHAIQIVGWGQEPAYGNVPYWIVANSWGATNTATTPSGLDDFGNNGYFMMIRGRNAAALESNVVAGVPKVHPNLIGARGLALSDLTQRMCNVTRYEINTDTLKALDAGRFVSIPDIHTMYQFTLPPLSHETVGHVKKFSGCPSDRTTRCSYTGLCVTSPFQCGSNIPSQGKVVPNSKVNSELAAAREIQLKYVQQLAKEERAARRQQNLAKRTERLARASVKQGPVQTKGRLQSRTRQSIMVILTILVLAVFLILSLLILMCIKQKGNVIPLSSY
jgi:cathepsin B